MKSWSDKLSFEILFVEFGWVFCITLISVLSPSVGHINDKWSDKMIGTCKHWRWTFVSINVICDTRHLKYQYIPICLQVLPPFTGSFTHCSLQKLWRMVSFVKKKLNEKFARYRLTSVFCVYVNKKYI